MFNELCFEDGLNAAVKIRETFRKEIKIPLNGENEKNRKTCRKTNITAAASVGDVG